jgi:hypothetical protein
MNTTFDTSALALAKGRTRAFQIPDHTSLEVHVASGACWVTLEGDREDYVVSETETLLLSGPGLVVVEGLAERSEAAVALLAAA